MYTKFINKVNAAKVAKIITERATVRFQKMDDSFMLTGYTTGDKRAITLCKYSNGKFELQISDSMMESTNFWNDVFPTEWHNVDQWEGHYSDLKPETAGVIIRNNWAWQTGEDEGMLPDTILHMIQLFYVKDELLIAKLNQQIEVMPQRIRDIIGEKFAREIADCLSVRMYDNIFHVLNTFREIVSERVAVVVLCEWPRPPIILPGPVARKPRKAPAAKRPPRRKDKGGELC